VCLASHGDRFAAEEIYKMSDPGHIMTGFYLQLTAVNLHLKSSQQLAKMWDEVGRQRIQVLSGKLDQVVTLPLFGEAGRRLGRRRVWCHKHCAR
jgi:hypothetical protein